jgi:hypothetical protein
MLRILDVIQGIGAPLGPEDYYHISSLLDHRATKVRAKAAEILGALSPDGPPTAIAPNRRGDYCVGLA